jgi:succinate-acetate transporter protein
MTMPVVLSPSSRTEDGRASDLASKLPATVVAIADPGPLGLGAFALTTFCLSVFNANIIGNGALLATLLPLALFYGGITQVLAGMWEFKKNNTFGALAFSSYGSFWLAYAAFVKFVAPGLPAGQVHEAAGLFLLTWTIFTLYMLVASAATSRTLFATFAVLSFTFILLTIGALGNHPLLTKVGGGTGFLTAALAWYGSMAGVTNSTWGRTVLPTWPVKK